MKRKELIGKIGVDSARCYIGDPCYIVVDEDFGEQFGVIPFPGDRTDGQSGAAIVVPTGYGDGIYPVFVERTKDGVIASVTIQFIEPE